MFFVQAWSSSGLRVLMPSRALVKYAALKSRTKPWTTMVVLFHVPILCEVVSVLISG